MSHAGRVGIGRVQPQSFLARLTEELPTGAENFWIPEDRTVFSAELDDARIDCAPVGVASGSVDAFLAVSHPLKTIA